VAYTMKWQRSPPRTFIRIGNWIVDPQTPDEYLFYDLYAIEFRRHLHAYRMKPLACEMMTDFSPLFLTDAVYYIPYQVTSNAPEEKWRKKQAITTEEKLQMIKDDTDGQDCDLTASGSKSLFAVIWNILRYHSIRPKTARR
jgi:hypothetical protein